MKKIAIIIFAAVSILSSCKNKELERQVAEQQAVNDATREELAAAVADRDQLISLVNEIGQDMAQIRQLEDIISVSGTAETPGQRDQIRADIASIQQTLQQRRERLDELERRLNASNLNNTNLQRTVESLRQQIDQQADEIVQLRSNLDEARSHIGELDATVDSLNIQVTNVTAERDSTNVLNTQLTDELNACYYAIGTKDELKNHRIIETGFLRRTKVMESDFDRTFFTQADKRNLPAIDLNSTDAEVLSNHPAESYTIEDTNGRKVLRITNPDEFWSLTKYLVVKID